MSLCLGTLYCHKCHCKSPFMVFALGGTWSEALPCGTRCETDSGFGTTHVAGIRMSHAAVSASLRDPPYLHTRVEGEP